MKKNLLLLFIFISGITFSQSKEYTGVVKGKSDNFPLAGVNVIIKGTKTGTRTDFDGNFKITVPDSLKILSFSDIGFKPLDYKINKSEFIEILLKEDCTICRFESQQIGIYLIGGIINTPIGGQFDLSLPAIFGTPILKSGIGYQTNFNENRFLNAYINLEHLFQDCGFSIDINSSVINLNYDNNINSNSYHIESGINISKIEIAAGFSNVQYIELDKNKTIKSNGPIIGFGTRIGKPFYTSVKVKTSVYKGLSEYQVGIKRNFKRLSSFIQYYRIGSFNEVSLGIGYQFTYYLKKRKE